MPQLTLEQQRAVAIASARLRLKQAEGQSIAKPDIPMEGSIPGTLYGIGSDIVTGLRDTAKEYVKSAQPFTPRHPEDKPRISSAQSKIVGDIVTAPIKAGFQELYRAPSEGGSMAATVAAKPVTVPLAIMGGDVAGGMETIRHGETARGLIEMSALPILGLFSGRLAGKYLKTSRPISLSTREVNAFADAVNPTIRSGVMDQEVAMNLAGLTRVVAEKLGVKDRKFWERLTGRAEALPSRGSNRKVPIGEGGAVDKNVLGNILRGGSPEQLDKVAKAIGIPVTKVRNIGIEIINETAKLADEPVSKIVSTFSDNRVPELKAKIIADLIEDAESYTINDPQIAAAIRDHIKKLESMDNRIVSINDLKKHANKETDSLYGLVQPGKIIATDAKVITAWEKLGDRIRQNLYPELQKLSNVEIGPLLNLESKAIQARDGIFKTFYNEVAPAHASIASKTFFERLIGEGDVGGGGGGGSSLFTRQMASRAAALRPTPAGEFNKMLRRGIGEIGEGNQPPRIFVGPQEGTTHPLALLPPHEYTFTLKTGLPVEVLEGRLATRPIQSVTRERHPRINTPVEDLATRKWSFTSESMGEGGKYRSKGGGGLTTTDPEMVRQTISAINDALKSHQTPRMRHELQRAQTDLVRQLLEYERITEIGDPLKTVTTTPLQPGRVTRTAPGARTVGAGVPSMTANQRKR